MKKEDFPSQLGGRLWHTTSPERYHKVVSVGYILPEPELLDHERWCTAQGPEYYPYVRSLGGVSLFDFNRFDPNKYDEKYPLSCWREFVPYRRSWGQSIWIEIDRESVAVNLICPERLLEAWKQDGACNRNIMPMIEAAHLGPIPLAAFTSVLKYDDDSKLFETLTCPK